MRRDVPFKVLTFLTCLKEVFKRGTNIASPVRYSHLPTLPDDNAAVFDASVLMSYCNFSSLILSSIVLINFYILSKRFFMKHERLSDVRVASITEKIWLCCTCFMKINKVLKVYIWWVLKCDLLKFLFVWNFHNEIESRT